MSAAYRTSSQQMQNYLDGFNLTYLNNVRFNISQGAAMDSTNSRLMTSNGTLTITTTTSGSGGIDTGSVAANSGYSVFMIMTPDGQTVSTLASLGCPASPNAMPSGFSYYRRIGSFTTDSSANLVPYNQTGDYFWLNPGVNVGIGTSVTTGGAALGPGFNGTFSYVPYNNGLAIGFTYTILFIPTINSYNNNQGNAINFSSPSQTLATPSVYGVSPTSTSMKQAYTVVGGSAGEGSADCQNPTMIVPIVTNTGNVLAKASSVNTTVNTYILGWIDLRGKS